MARSRPRFRLALALFCALAGSIATGPGPASASTCHLDERPTFGLSDSADRPGAAIDDPRTAGSKRPLARKMPCSASDPAHPGAWPIPIAAMPLGARVDPPSLHPASVTIRPSADLSVRHPDGPAERPPRTATR